MACLLSVLIACSALSTACSSCDDDDHHDHAHGGSGSSFYHSHDDDNYNSCEDDDYHYHGSKHDSHKARANVVVTDNAVDEVQSFYLTFRQILLISDELEEPQVLYESTEGTRIDLLALRGTPESRLYELLVAGAEVEPAAYHAIRIHTGDPTLVLESGQVIAADEVDLIANGWLEVSFATPVLGAPEDEIFLLLDFDVPRSVERFESDETGERTAEWRLRPLVLVDSHREEIIDVMQTPVDVRGHVVSEPDGDTFAFELADGRGQILVELDDEGAISDTRLESATRQAIVADQEAAIRGWVGESGSLELDSMILGETVRFSGRIREVGTYARDDVVPLEVAPTPGQEQEEEILLELRPTTHCSTKGRVEIADANDLVPGQSVAVTAVAVEEEAGDSEIVEPALAIAFVDLRSPDETDSRLDQPDLDDPTEPFVGLVSWIDLDDRLLAMEDLDDGVEERFMVVPEDARIFYVEEIDGVLAQTQVQARPSSPEILVLTPGEAPEVF
jgi:hypothetical protein